MKYKVTGVLSVILFLLLTSWIYAGTSKEYAMVYFKFGPEDLKIRVFPDNENLTDQDHTDYIISQIKNSQCKLYLVKKFPNERELVHYRYRVIFYKPQNIGNKNYDIPIYSFKISFSGDAVVVEYPPSKAIPAEIKKNNLKKSFKKTPGSNIYYLKDYTGGDFALYDRMRRVKFTGFIKNANGTYTKVPNKFKIKVRLTKLNSDKGDTNLSQREREINMIDVPLNEEIVVGMVPYELSSPSDRDRYQLKFLRINDEESPFKIIHFGEVWNNLYEQALVYQDDGYYLDVNFDNQIYTMEYSVGTKESTINQQNTSPLTIFLKDYDHQLLQFKLVGKAYASRYLEEPAPIIQLKTDASKRAWITAKDLAVAYPNDIILKDDGQIFIQPRYKKTLFSIFTEPEGARLRIKRIDPVSGLDRQNFHIVAQSPAFFDQFEYGRYVIAADWFEKGAYDLEVKTVTRKITIEISDSPDPELAKPIHWIQKQDTRMPFVTLKYDSNAPDSESSGFQIEPLFNSNTTNTNNNILISNSEAKNSNSLSNRNFKTNIFTVTKAPAVTNDKVKGTPIQTTDTNVSVEISQSNTRNTRNIRNTENTDLTLDTNITDIKDKEDTNIQDLPKTTEIKRQAPQVSITNDFVPLEPNDSENIKTAEKQKNPKINIHSILKGSSTLYYVQIAAFKWDGKQKTEKTINDFIKKKISANESFNRVFDFDEVWSGVKIVKNKTFIILCVGAFSRSEAKVARQELLKWFPGAFIISDRQIQPMGTEAIK